MLTVLINIAEMAQAQFNFMKSLFKQKLMEWTLRLKALLIFLCDIC